MQLTSADGAVVELRPRGYEHPAVTAPGDLDANWLLVHGRVRTAAGESWTFEEPSLTTWEAQELLGWLRAATRGRLEPVAGEPGWTREGGPGLHEFSVPLRLSRAQLQTSAAQWGRDIAPFPPR